MNGGCIGTALCSMRVLGAGGENRGSRCFQASLVSGDYENRKIIRVFRWAFCLFSSRIRL